MLLRTRYVRRKGLPIIAGSTIAGLGNSGFSFSPPSCVCRKKDLTSARFLRLSLVAARLHKLSDKVPRVEYLRLDLPLLLVVLSLMAFNLAVFLSAEHSVSMLINTHG